MTRALQKRIFKQYPDWKEYTLKKMNVTMGTCATTLCQAVTSLPLNYIDKRDDEKNQKGLSPLFYTKGISNPAAEEHSHTFCHRQHTWHSRASCPRAIGEAQLPTQQEQKAGKLKTGGHHSCPKEDLQLFLILRNQSMSHLQQPFTQSTFVDHPLCPEHCRDTKISKTKSLTFRICSLRSKEGKGIIIK